MALDDLSRVTRAIIKLIEQNLLDKWNLSAPDLVVTPLSPDDALEASSVGNIVSVHLFHYLEDAYYKNAAPVGGTGSVPQRHTPLALTLNYVVTIHQQASPPNVLARQQIMGYVLKTLHDFPTITAATTIGGIQPLFEAGILTPDNDIHLVLRPVTVDESINFWTAEKERVTPLSAFFEARVILIESEPPEVLPGIVLSVGNYIFASTGPSLVASQNDIRFFPPAPAALMRLVASPARVAMFDGAGPFGDARNDNNLLLLKGSSLSGDRTILTLERNGKASRIDLTAAALPGAITNAAWAPVIQSAQITARVQRTLVDFDTAATVSLVPGIYSARVHVIPAGFLDAPTQIRERASTKIAFAISPQILTVNQASAPTYTITLVGSYVDYPSGSDPDLVEVELGVGTEIFTDVGAAGIIVDGTFKRGVSGPNGTITFKRTVPVPDPLASGPLPIQLTINGATAPPAWITQ